MSDLFASAEMAEGYARFRPAVHPHVIERIRRRLRISGRLGLALDVGCGAGMSTAALEPIAARRIGIDPALAMLGWARMVAPGAEFVAARAEAIPIRSHSVDLITAAGSLNWADLEEFFPEASRVLKQDGTLVIYDFSEGRTFRDSPSLDEWYSEFLRRYPSPPCREVRPEASEDFEVGLVLDPQFYLEYVLTETNVAEAIRNGVDAGEIRAWCAATLAPVFEGRPREVLFRGYVAHITP